MLCCTDAFFQALRLGNLHWSENDGVVSGLEGGGLGRHGYKIWRWTSPAGHCRTHRQTPDIESDGVRNNVRVTHEIFNRRRRVAGFQVLDEGVTRNWQPGFRSRANQL